MSTKFLILSLVLPLTKSLQETSCPAKCNCGFYVDALYVDCKRAGYTSIPELPENVEYLYMQYNDMRWIDESLNNFTAYQNLSYVNLDNNPKLSGITENIFSKNEKLEFLFMKNSGIRHFSGFTIPKMSVFEANSDSMISFDLDSFVLSNKNLKKSDGEAPVSIKIGGKQLTSINTETKYSLVPRVDISIEVAETGEFDIPKILSKFPNARNFQMYGSWQFFGDLSLASLKFTNPFYDNLQQFNLYAFSDISDFLKMPVEFLPLKLTSLGLLLCQVTDDTIDGFVSNLSVLESLIMPNNLLTEVPFEKLSKRLKKVDLSGNKLKHFDGSVFSNYHLDSEYSLTRFIMDGNPFECDCGDLGHQSFLKTVFTENSTDLWNDYNYECSNFRNTKIVEVDLNYCDGFTTDKTTTEHVTEMTVTGESTSVSNTEPITTDSTYEITTTSAATKIAVSILLTVTTFFK